MPALYSTVVQLAVAHVMYDGWVLPGLPVHLVKSAVGGERGAVPDLGQVRERRWLLVVVAAGEAEDRVTHLRGLVDEVDHAGHGRELLVLDPRVLEDRVVVEVHRPVLHVVVPERGVVDVQDDGGLAGLGVLGEVGALVVEELGDLADVRRLLLVRDAVAGRAVVGADRRLDRVDVRDGGAGLGRTAGAVRLHHELRARRERVASLLGGGGAGAGGETDDERAHGDSGDRAQT